MFTDQVFVSGMADVSKSVKPTFDVARFIQVLHERFIHITNLRTMTSRRHVTFSSLAGGFLIALFTQGSPQVDPKSIAAPVFWVLTLMGAFVTVYDAMMNHRAKAVAIEMHRALKWHVFANQSLPEEGGSKRARGSSLEDFFYFSQIMFVNAVLMTVAVKLLWRPGPNVTVADVLICVAGIGLFSGIWFLARYGYSQYTGVSTWLPTAGDEHTYRHAIMLEPATSSDNTDSANE